MRGRHGPDSSWLVLRAAAAVAVVVVGVGGAETVGGAGGAGGVAGAARTAPGAGGAAGGAPGAGPIDFARDIRPVLAGNCFKCHGPDARARKAGLRLDTRDGAIAPLRSGVPAIVPGDPDAGALVARLASHDEDFRMPPAEERPRLDDGTISLVREWIAQGAVYEPHWAFVAPERPAPPPVEDAAWPANDIDRFVLARLEEEGLRPAPAADRPALIRRVTLDLTGLPPTPGDVEAFVNDDRPDAWERVVDRLLDDPAYGERWARVWLDLARYADTKGYEVDRRRTIWPWRDWVIRALNRDVPFDRFTIEQLAGDLLETPTRDQQLATAFHRNTMTNDEGGTDDEEFRAAAVVDRVNTTMQVWMGVTMSCAQCHDHKYDPISQREYYELYAFLDTTQDTDAMDEAPTLEVPDEAQAARRAQINRERVHLDVLIQRELAGVTSDVGTETPADGGADAHDAHDAPRDSVWIDDDLPVGVEAETSGSAAGEWQWADDHRPPARSGVRTWGGSADAGVTAQHFFMKAHFPPVVAAGDVLFVDVHLDPRDPPRQIMLQWHDTRDWEHRAYWGANVIAWGADGTPSRLARGPLPDAGRWVRLEVPAADVGLAPGDAVAGWAFTHHGGTVRWDRAGVRGTTRHDERHLASQLVWEDRAKEIDPALLPRDVVPALAVAAGERSGEERELLRTYYLRNVHRPTRRQIEPLLLESDRLAAELRHMSREVPHVPVMREQPPSERRTSHVHRRGSFLDKGDVVTPGVPAIFPPLPAEAPRNRLGLARWLVSADNPLTARVAVNRLWAQLFGTGLVETQEDFGIRGAPPTHPRLLDWLATELVAGDWSLKRILRTIATSSTYRQSSAVTAALLERDPGNRLLARGPRLRLEAEMIRDQALAVAGLLSRDLYGPPVFPPQPAVVWSIIYSNDLWTTSEGPDRHRRALYTFWRRTSPYPSSVTFDAPSREFCVPRRIRTNTPLQALVTLNDPVYVEAAQALARRIVTEAPPAAEARAARGVRLCLARPAQADEIAALVALHEDARAGLRADPEAALALATDPLGPLPPDLAGADCADLAAWTVVANVLLNLDEFLVKR